MRLTHGSLLELPAKLVSCAANAPQTEQLSASPATYLSICSEMAAYAFTAAVHTLPCRTTQAASSTAQAGDFQQFPNAMGMDVLQCLCKSNLSSQHDPVIPMVNLAVSDWRLVCTVAGEREGTDTSSLMVESTIALCLNVRVVDATPPKCLVTAETCSVTCTCAWRESSCARAFVACVCVRRRQASRDAHRSLPSDPLPAAAALLPAAATALPAAAAGPPPPPLPRPAAAAGWLPQQCRPAPKTLLPLAGSAALHRLKQRGPAPATQGSTQLLTARKQLHDQPIASSSWMGLCDCGQPCSRLQSTSRPHY